MEILANISVFLILLIIRYFCLFIRYYSLFLFPVNYFFFLLIIHHLLSLLLFLFSPLFKVLGYLHKQKHMQTDVDEMLLHLYDPILWRSLKVSSHRIFAYHQLVTGTIS